MVFKNNELAKGSVKGKFLKTVTKVKTLQPFFITKPTGQGQGVGLSLAYDIVAKGHGGVPIAKGIRWKVCRVWEVSLCLN